MNDQFYEKTISSRRIHEGRIINLREDTVLMPSGREAKREIVEHKGAVAIVPLWEDGTVVTVRQFRKPCEKTLLEIPAGGLNIGEDPADCARRELLEECGLIPGKLTPFFSIFLAPGYSTELIHVFLAEELEQTEAEPEEDENLQIETHSVDELVKLITNGGIRDAKTVSAIMTLKVRLSG